MGRLSGVQEGSREEVQDTEVEGREARVEGRGSRDERRETRDERRVSRRAAKRRKETRVEGPAASDEG